MIDRRVSPRVKADLSAVIKTPREEGVSFAAIQNLGLEGICFLTKQRLACLRQFSFKFELPDDEQLNLSIEPRWIQEIELLSTSEYKVGARIANTATAAFAKYTKFYRAKLKESPAS